MGIKTFVKDKEEELDKAVNDFMAAQGKDCPVRTNTIVVSNNETYHIKYVATVFFDMFKKPSKNDFFTSKNISEDSHKQVSDRIGVLWKQTDGSVSGKLNGHPFVLTDEIKSALEEKTTKAGDFMMVGMIGQNNVLIIKNKFKKEKKHPDFVILRGDRR